MKIFAFLVSFISFSTFNLYGQAMNFPIIPTPQQVEVISGQEGFNLKDNLKIEGVNNEKLLYAAKELKKSLEKKVNKPVKIEKNFGQSGIQFLLVENLNITAPQKLIDEAYILSIRPSLIKITAKTEKGIYYGTMSLIQLIENTTGNRLAPVKITDWPDMKIRGISDDISRGQVSTLKNFKRIISFISRYKMNTYMPYMEDMFKFKAYPSIGKGRGALTKTEVAELVSFAKEHFVDVIPVFQTLGHYENILTQDKFLKYAEFPGAASLNISSDETYIFLEKLLKEIFEAFPSTYFHMGADESYDVGLGKSKAIVDSIGIAEAHLMHYKKVFNICKKYGKKVMMYGDILLRYPEIIDKLPKDITIVNWRYYPRFEYPTVYKFKNSGLRQIVSPSVWNFLTTFPNYEFAEINIKNFTASGKANDAIGMINSNWGDYGAEMPKELILYGYAWSAQCSWNLSRSNINDFNIKYFNDFFGMHNNSLSRIYKGLSNISGLVFWNDAWMHPLSKRKYKAWWAFNIPAAVRADQITQNLMRLKPLIEKFKSKATKNKDHFDILNFVIDFNDWFALKLKTSEKLLYILNGKEQDTLGCLPLIDENIKRLSSLKKQHAAIWKKYYKPANLNFVLDKYDRLITYFKEIKEQLKNHQLESPLIKSKWIRYPKPDSNFTAKAVFTKYFNITGNIKSAMLQTIADTYAEVYINGKYIDKVFARRAASLVVEYKRIKMFDIKNYLHPGKNIIEVKAKNFNGDAGINIDALIKTDGETIELQTDKSWMAKRSETDNFVNAEEYEYPYNIIAPNFKTKRTSWIER